MNVVSVRGGKVHTGSTTYDHTFPLCRTGAQSSSGITYRETAAAVDCKTCVGYIEAAAARDAREAQGENMAAKNTTKATATEEIDESLAGVLDETPEPAAKPAHEVSIEQVRANIERAKSLAEAENADGLKDLKKETEDVISSLPRAGRHDGKSWTEFKKGLRAEFAAAAQAREVTKVETAEDRAKAKVAEKAKQMAAKNAEVEAKAKAEAEAADYTKVEGVADRVTAGADLIYNGVQLHVKTAQTARQAAEMLLDAQRLILTKDGVPDLKSADPKSTKARKDMYEAARAKLAEEGDADHAKALVEKFSQSVRNQFSDVLVSYVRELDKESAADEVKALYGKVLEAHPDMTPSEAVFTYYEIPRLSKRELMAENQRAKSAKLKELEAKAEEGDAEAAETVEKLKTATVHERIAADWQAAEKALTAAVKAAKELSDDDKAALKAKFMELVALAAQI